MLGRHTHTQSSSRRHRTWLYVVSVLRKKTVLALLCLVFIPATIISLTNLTTPSAYAALSVEECYALNDRVDPEEGIYDDLWAERCSVESSFTTISKEQMEADCEPKYGGTWVDPLGLGWRCEEIPSTGTQTGSGPNDPTIQTKAACDEAGGTWTADGNFEGPGEQGVCAVSPGSSEDINEEEEELSCRIDSIGWILCPIVNSMGSLTDASYGMVEELLTVQSGMFNESSRGSGYSSLNSAWSAMRNLANVAFVIAFLIIIYSQLTGAGVGNYGVKKMLPRLIISAILVNASFLIGALAVDLSNLIGTSTSAFIDGLSQNMNAGIDGNQYGSGNFWEDLSRSVLAGGLLVTGAAAVAGATTATGAMAWIGITILLPILIAVVAAILTALIVLTLRQALIVVLIVVAPLAFVAFLLPNTESLFKKWLGLFIALLAMFPAIALVFSVSKLAGMIVMESGESVLIQIAGAGMTIIPLFITPILIKTAGSTLGKLTGMVNQKGKGIYGMQRNLKENEKARRKNHLAKNMQGGKGFMGRYRRLRGTPSRLIANQKARDQRTEIAANAARSGAMLENHSQFLDKQNALDPTNKKDAKKIVDPKVVSAVRGQLQGDEQTDIKNAVAELQMQSADELQVSLVGALKNGDNIKTQAAIELLSKKGGYGMKKLDETFLGTAQEQAQGVPSKAQTYMDEQFKKGNKGLSIDVARTLEGTGAVTKSETLKNWSGQVQSSGAAGASFREAQQMAMSKVGNLSAAKFANQSPHEQEKMLKTGNVSKELATNVLSSTRAGDIDSKIIEKLQTITDGAGGSLSIPHGSTSTTAAQTASTKSAPTAQQPAPSSTPTIGGQSTAGWSETDSGLSIPRGVSPTTTTPAAAPAPAPAAATPQPAPVTTQQAAPAQPQKVDVNFTVNDKREPYAEGFSGFSGQKPAPAQPAPGSHTDTTGRQTPNSAASDYHDRMSR